MTNSKIFVDVFGKQKSYLHYQYHYYYSNYHYDYTINDYDYSFMYLFLQKTDSLDTAILEL